MSYRASTLNGLFYVILRLHDTPLSSIRLTTKGRLYTQVSEWTMSEVPYKHLRPNQVLCNSIRHSTDM